MKKKREIKNAYYAGYLAGKNDGKTKLITEEDVNLIEWVQEYIDAVGEQHKKNYIDTLTEIMEKLMKMI